MNFIYILFAATFAMEGLTANSESFGARSMKPLQKQDDWDAKTEVPEGEDQLSQFSADETEGNRLLEFEENKAAEEANKASEQITVEQMEKLFQEMESAMNEAQENGIKEFYLQKAATESLDAEYHEVVKSYVEKFQETVKQYNENESVIQAKKALNEAITAATTKLESAMQEEKVTRKEAITAFFKAQADARKTYEDSTAEARKLMNSVMMKIDSEAGAAFAKNEEAIKLAKNDPEVQAKAASMREADEQQMQKELENFQKELEQDEQMQKELESFQKEMESFEKEMESFVKLLFAPQAAASENSKQ